jgi:DNA repair protein RecN (Recombination protein N)
MLTTLRIKNLALVSDQTLEMQPGYNVITGETGAGKSILIGALNLVLGQRADRMLLRSGTDQCSVEAVFDTTNLKAPLNSFLNENGLEPCEEQQLILKRSFTGAGGNRQFINGSPASLAALAAIGEWLVDIHGPHEHQSLLHPARQLAILDAFGRLEGSREAFADLIRRRAALESEKAGLIIDEKTYAQQLDLLRFQINEIAAAGLRAEEGAQVEQEHVRARNAARLLELSQAALNVLSENENSLMTQAGQLGRNLLELQRVDPSAKAILSLHEDAVSALRNLQAELSHYGDKVELDPLRLKQLEDRLNVIHALKKKYGASVSEVIAFGEEARRKLAGLEQRETELARINGALQKLESEIVRAGQDLSANRRKVIPKLSKLVSKELSDLGFKQSLFEINLATALPETGYTEAHASRITHHASSTGFDTIEFQFAPNPGEAPHLLRAIASSGELARVMLALKTVLAEQDEIPVLIFDEVDANIGGETANVVGQKMRRIAQNRQVLCITHLPQVAATASAHYLVTKQIKEGRTTSEITLLEADQRVTELARMLGGQSGPARTHAEALAKGKG